jgi:co-chaperonin GroES (HSP10)
VSVIIPARAIDILSTSADPRQAILDLIAPALPKIDVLYNRVMVATYIRPEKTKGGIIRPDSNKGEDQWQGKVGLVVKVGTHAFDDDEENAFKGVKAKIGDWVVYKVGDAWEVMVNGKEQMTCRFVRDTAIIAKVTDPEVIL